MSWKDLLNSSDSEQTLPWFGFKRVHDAVRSWTLFGAKPPEHGWWRFVAPGGRDARLATPEPQQLDPSWGEGQSKLKGYLVGDRFIADTARVETNPDKLIDQTVSTYCVEPGLERFARVNVVVDREQHLVYMGQEFPIGPEVEVTKAYQDRAESVVSIPGVTPALDLAFRFLSHQRVIQEKRREDLRRMLEEEARKRTEKERVEKLMQDAGSAIGRRALAGHDFEAAAREALRVSGAELLDARQARNKNEMVVQYRFEQRRFECVVEKYTLRIIDSGICLQDHATGIKGDTWLTLESLPGVVAEATRQHKLVVYRHVDGEDEEEPEDW